MKLERILPTVQQPISRLRRFLFLFAIILALLFPQAWAAEEVVFHGRMLAPQYPGSSENAPMSAVYCFGSADGPDRQAIAYITRSACTADFFAAQRVHDAQ